MTIEHELDLTAFTATQGSAVHKPRAKDAKGNWVPEHLTGAGSFGWVLISAPYTVQAGDEISATANGLSPKARGNVFLVVGAEVKTGDGGGAIPPKVTAPTVLLNSASTGMAGSTDLTATIPEGHDESTPLHFGIWAATADSFHLKTATLTVPIPAEPEPEPDPEPDPEPGEGGPWAPQPPAEVLRRVRTLTGVADEDTELIAVANETAALVTAMAHGYTRGTGFDDDGIPDGRLAAVIVAAAARLFANPEQVDFFTGSVGVRTTFKGWTLAEQQTMNNYRQRWA